MAHMVKAHIAFHKCLATPTILYFETRCVVVFDFSSGTLDIILVSSDLNRFPDVHQVCRKPLLRIMFKQGQVTIHVLLHRRQ